MKLLKNINSIKEINLKLKQNNLKLKEVEARAANPKLAQRLKENGVIIRLEHKNDVLMQIKYELEKSSLTIRLLTLIGLL
jgi:hypothetical protein